MLFFNRFAKAEATETGIVRVKWSEQMTKNGNTFHLICHGEKKLLFCGHMRLIMATQNGPGSRKLSNSKK